MHGNAYLANSYPFYCTGSPSFIIGVSVRFCLSAHNYT